MTKTRLVMLFSLVLTIGAISNYYSYLFGFTSARITTVNHILYLHVVELDECINDKSLECVKNLSFIAKLRMCQLSRDLIDINVGIDDETMLWLTERLDEIPMNCLESLLEHPDALN